VGQSDQEKGNYLRKELRSWWGKYLGKELRIWWSKNWKAGRWEFLEVGALIDWYWKINR
jgi:hypothetical protein